MKKNLITRTVAVALAGALCAGMVGCGNNNQPAASSSASAKSEAPAASSSSKTEEPAASSSSSKTEAPAEDFATGLTIAQNSFLAGDYAFSSIANAGKVVVEGSGNNFQELTDNADINNILVDVENMINSGVDGALWWGVLDNYFQVGPQQFNDAQVPFAFFDCAPSEESGLMDQINEMEYFAGYCMADNATFGEQMAEKAVADGCKKAIIFANEIGSAVAVRAERFKEVFEAAGGEVYEISHVSTTANAHVEATQNMLATYPDVDCIYAVSIDFILGAYTITSQMPDRNIKLYATDTKPEAIEYLVNNQIQGLNGGHFVVDICSAALLLNTIDGHRIEDENGKPLNLSLNAVVVTPENAELYNRFWIEGNPFEYDDIKHLLYRENPDVTAQDFYDFCENYSIDTVIKNKVAQGLCTEEEAKAAGVEL